MAHPIDQRSIDEILHDELRRPDNWVNAFMVVMFVVALLSVLYLS